jgi:NADPH-dependent curcumin reductase CurA
MRSPEIQSYSSAFELNKPMTGGGVAEVVQSNSSKVKVGDVVVAFIDWANYTVVHEKAISQVVDQEKFKSFPLHAWVGLLGMPSFTAYVGLVKIGTPKKGETLYVSAAAGAVGQVVGQIGKRLGLRVVGSAGSDDKVSSLVENLGYDAAFNYKTQPIAETLRKLCPNGIDIYFENVGGEMLDIVLTQMNQNGRIPVCGMISQYNKAGSGEEEYGVKNLINVLSKRLLMQGFIIGDHYHHYPEFLEFMVKNTADGKFVYETTIEKGIENAPKAFIGLLEGKNKGKQLLEF